MECDDESHGLWIEAALWSGGPAADTSGSFAGWQQSEQIVAVVGVQCYMSH